MATNRDTSSDKASSHKQIPFKEGLFSIPASPSEKAHLIGGKCQSCGESFFPKWSHCLKCTSDAIDEINVGNKGHLLTYTIIRQQPPRYIGTVPYALGIVELESGARATSGLICEPDPEVIRIGMEMELVLIKGMENEEGDDIMVFKFKPTGK